MRPLKQVTSRILMLGDIPLDGRNPAEDLQDGARDLPVQRSVRKRKVSQFVATPYASVLVSVNRYLGPIIHSQAEQGVSVL